MIRRARRSEISIVLGSALITLLAGCLGTTATQDYYYHLDLPKPSLRRRQSRLNAKRQALVLGHVTTAPGYSSERMVYRVIPNEIRYYVHRRWVAGTEKLIAQAVGRHLHASGRFVDIQPETKAAEAAPVLDLNVEAIEEIDLPTETRARLALTFTLRSSATNEILSTQSFDRSVICTERHPRAVAQKIGAILSAEMPRIAENISTRLRSLRRSATPHN